MDFDDDEWFDDAPTRFARALARLRAEVERSRRCADDTRKTLAHASRAVSAATSNVMIGARPQRRILIVEDNVDAATALQRGLSAFGYLVEAVHAPACALALARYFAPDIALLDLGLPEIDGWQLAQELQKVAPPMYMIAVTGYGEEADRRRSRDVGFFDHLLKPVDLHVLARMVGELVPAGNR